MFDREKLQNAIAQAILPYTQEIIAEDIREEDPLMDPFVIETAAFLTQELIDSKIDISDDQADLDDEDLENLLIAQILTPHLRELLSAKDPMARISSILQIYTAPEPVEVHRHVQYGECEVGL